MKRLFQIAMFTAAILVIVVVSHAPAQAATWSDWYVVKFDPYGPAPTTTDLLRVSLDTSGERHTRCDFLAQNQYDVTLAGTATSGIRGSLRTCVPGYVRSIR